MANSQIFNRALEILQREKEGLEEVIENLDSSFVSALNLILRTPVRVVVTGVGKSCLIEKNVPIEILKFRYYKAFALSVNY